MIVEDVALHDFRNYADLYVKLNPKMNILMGANAQGKTNFLESIVYMSLTRSHRIRDDKGLIRYGTDFADIRCTIDGYSAARKLEAVLSGRGKNLLVMGQPVKRASDFIGQLNAVLFSPDDLYLFQESPRQRRKTMNSEITKVSRVYLSSLNDYQKLLKDRNVLLKEIYPDPALLDTLDEEMSKAEEKIIFLRKEFFRELNENIDVCYQQLSGMNDHLKIQYVPCTDKDILQMHRDARNRDLLYKITTVGIHKEDFSFLLNGQNVITIASQGQKRMAMLAFKLSLLRYVEKNIHQMPVLLLDDVLSELDHTRQDKLLNILQKTECQCVITTTETQLHVQGNYDAFTVQNGLIERR